MNVHCTSEASNWAIGIIPGLAVALTAMLMSWADDGPIPPERSKPVPSNRPVGSRLSSPQPSS